MITIQLINGSLLTTALRLRAAHHALTAQHQHAHHQAETLPTPALLPAPALLSTGVPA
jgi:hypothetical protein